MPARIYVVNRYCSDDPVAGAALTFGGDPVTAQSPRTGPNGWATIAMDTFADGEYVLKITPAHTSQLPVGPEVAENLAANVTRMFRSLDVRIVVKKGQAVSAAATAGQEENGAVVGLSPLNIQLQPIFFKGLGEYSIARKPEGISLIVIHQTAGSTSVHGSLSWFKSRDENGKVRGSPHYLVSADAKPQVIKISRDGYPAGHAGGTLSAWGGNANADMFSIGIENSHAAKTLWPRAQVDRLIRLLEQLVKAYPTISRHRIVGHTDVLSIDRDCPGLEFDWALLEREGLGMVPRSGSVSLDLAYGGFFRLEPTGKLQQGNNDTRRVWGNSKDSKGNPKIWPANPAGAVFAGSNIGGVANIAGQDVGNSVRNVTEAVVATLVQGQTPVTVSGAPIRELQTDLRDIGYNVMPDGDYGKNTKHAVEMFQKHFFAGSRRGLVAEGSNSRGSVDAVTAEYIKRVRP
jgi:N-acetyl-anhydromuramyl-L-alanine amidase AmpD